MVARDQPLPVVHLSTQQQLYPVLPAGLTSSFCATCAPPQSCLECGIALTAVLACAQVRLHHVRGSLMPMA
jgi:hypothetical protein